MTTLAQVTLCLEFVRCWIRMHGSYTVKPLALTVAMGDDTFLCQHLVGAHMDAGSGMRF